MEDEAGPAGTGAGNLGNGAEEILDDGDSAGFDGEIFRPETKMPAPPARRTEMKRAGARKNRETARMTERKPFPG